MARKKKEKTKLIETVQFQDVEHAKRAVTLAKINQIRILIGLIIAVVATGLTAYGLFGKPEEPMMYVGIAPFLAVPAYLIGGGIGNVLKTAWKITKIGWFLIPVFPADVLFAIAFFFLSIFGMCLVPVIFVGLNYLHHKKTLDAAKSYLAQCGCAIPTVEE